MFSALWLVKPPFTQFAKWLKHSWKLCRFTILLTGIFFDLFIYILMYNFVYFFLFFYANAWPITTHLSHATLSKVSLDRCLCLPRIFYFSLSHSQQRFQFLSYPSSYCHPTSRKHPLRPCFIVFEIKSNQNNLFAILRVRLWNFTSMSIIIVILVELEIKE